MEDHPATPMQPLMRSPLTFKGVFGIAWTLYKRSFKSLAPLCLLLVGLPVLLVMLPMLTTLNNFMQYAINDIEPPLESLGSFFGLFGLSWLLALVSFFLLTPMIEGCMYMEMDQCVEGRPGKLRDLLRYALPLSLKRFYGTYFAQYLVQLGVGLAIGLAMNGIMVIFFIPMIFAPLWGQSVMGMGYMPPESALPAAIPLIITGFVLLFLFLMLLVGAVGMVFYQLVYPTAVHEGKRAFKAVGRAFQLGTKRFGRVFCVNLLLMLALFVFMAIYMVIIVLVVFQSIQVSDPAIFAQSIITVTIPIGLVMTVIEILFYPFFAALNTALYIDSAARVPQQSEPVPAAYSRYGQPAGSPAQPTQPPQEPPYTSAYGQYGQPMDAPAPLQVPYVSAYGQPKDAPPAGENDDHPTEQL